MKKKELEEAYNKLMLEKRYKEADDEKIKRCYCWEDSLSILQFKKWDKENWEIIECEFYRINFIDREVIFKIKEIYTPSK